MQELQNKSLNKNITRAKRFINIMIKKKKITKMFTQKQSN